VAKAAIPDGAAWLPLAAAQELADPGVVDCICDALLGAERLEPIIVGWLHDALAACVPRLHPLMEAAQLERVVECLPPDGEILRRLTDSGCFSGVLQHQAETMIRHHWTLRAVRELSIARTIPLSWRPDPVTLQVAPWESTEAIHEAPALAEEAAAQASGWNTSEWDEEWDEEASASSPTPERDVPRAPEAPAPAPGPAPTLEWDDEW